MDGIDDARPWTMLSPAKLTSMLSSLDMGPHPMLTI